MTSIQRVVSLHEVEEACTLDNVQGTNDPPPSICKISTFIFFTIMPKSKFENKQRGKKKEMDNNADNDRNEKVPTKLDSLDDEDQGFGGWLRSADGQENMKLFVIANSVVLLTTLMFPYIQLVVDFIYDSIYGPDSEIGPDMV
ncbi:unnamed protein product, partial [Iphiclides podalirius]